MELEKITPELLDEEQRELAEIVGWEAYQKLLMNYAGCRIYIRMPEQIIKQVRDAEIRQNFNGYNYRQLALQYHLSESAIRKILSLSAK